MTVELLTLVFGLNGWTWTWAVELLVLELPVVELLALAFGFGGWAAGLAVELLAVELLALAFGFDGWSGALAVEPLVVAFEAGGGLAVEPLALAFGFGDLGEGLAVKGGTGANDITVFVAVVLEGRYASLMEVYVSKIAGRTDWKTHALTSRRISSSFSFQDFWLRAWAHSILP